MRYRLMASYHGTPYQAGVGPSASEVTLFAACPPAEEHGFTSASGHWRKQVRVNDIEALWESRPVGSYHGEPCLVLDDLGDRLHITYLGTDEARAVQLGYWQVDRGVFEVVIPRAEVSDLAEERYEFPLATLMATMAPLSLPAAPVVPVSAVVPAASSAFPVTGPIPVVPSGPVTGPFPAAAQYPPVTGPFPAAGPMPVTGPFPAAGPMPVTGPMPVAGPIPVAGPAPVTGPIPVAGPLPVTGPVPFTGQVPVQMQAPPVPSAAAWHGSPEQDGSWYANPRGNAASQPAAPVNGTNSPIYDAMPEPTVIEAPATAPPQSEPEHTRPQQSEPPRSEPPHAEPPRTEPPRSEPPRPEPPRTEPPRTESPRAEVPQSGPVVRGRRAARKPRVATASVFAELLDQASISRASYAVDEEVSGAMCLLKTGGGFEVFSCANDARHEVRFFEDEEGAYFYLFGVLAAEALRSGKLGPK